MRPMVAALSPAFVAPEKSVATDAAWKIARIRAEIFDEHLKIHHRPWTPLISGSKHFTLVWQPMAVLTASICSFNIE